jgi:glycosyltransferase involved in cell wall biosynthesis
MKIFQILPELNAGGVERGTLEIARYLVANGHESFVVSNGGRLVDQLEEEGSRHISMPVHRKSLASLFQVRPFQNLLEREKPDILHIRSRVPGWIAYLAWRFMDPASRPRFVSTVHGFYSVNRYSAVMTRGERVIAVSESTRRYVLENYPEIPDERIRVIPRGIDPAGYGQNRRPDAEWLAAWESAYPGFAGKCLLLLPGRITRLKGHEDFFRLVGALKQAGIPAHGLVAGDAHPKKQAYVEELKNKLAELGLAADVTFLGHRSDIREVMGVSTLVCALSQQPESFGRTVLEALALGKPVVGYDCGGVGELLGHLFPEGRVPLGDHTRLVDAATRIIRDRPVPHDVGEPYTLDAMCQATLEVYQELAPPMG